MCPNTHTASLLRRVPLLTLYAVEGDPPNSAPDEPLSLTGSPALSAGWTDARPPATEGPWPPDQRRWARLASLRSYGDPRRQSRGTHRRPVARHVPQRDPDVGWLGGEARRVGPSAPRVRDQQEDRGYLRRHRPAGGAAGCGGVGPSAPTQ